jgi:hypothetical protein
VREIRTQQALKQRKEVSVKIVEERPRARRYTTVLKASPIGKATAWSGRRRQESESHGAAVEAIMRKTTLVPGAQKRRLLCRITALVLLALQIPTSALAAPDRIADGLEMRVRLNNTLTTGYSGVDDTFTVTVVDPGPFCGARIVGSIQSIHQSGRFKGATEMYLSFDRIRLLDGESYSINGEIVRLYDTRSGEQVDAEGGIETSGRRPQTLKRIGIGALAAGIFGATVCGGKGAAGGGTTGAPGAKELVLDQGVEMLIRVYRR